MRGMKATVCVAASTLLCVLTACSEPLGPTQVLEQEDVAGPAVVEIAAGTGQSGTVGANLTVSPSVTVRTAQGQAMAGVVVHFVVTAGGGSVEKSAVVTDATGLAAAGVWKLGSTPGANELQASVSGLSPVKFTATGAAPAPAASAYDITVRYIGTATARQQQAVAAAVARWRSVIVGDLPSVPMNAPAGSCFETQPALNENVDDLLLYVDFAPIDGPGQVLGQAGPCYVRSETNLPVVGSLKLDAADLLKMEQTGTLDDVVLHEIGHVLGIGTLWPGSSLLNGAGTADPYYTGPRALNAYRSMGGVATGVPVENTGGEGTRDSHWRETEFGNELMTGFISAGGNPLSAMTASSLNDLGYGAVSTTASSYTLGGTRAGVVTQQPLELEGHEKLHRPKFKVDKTGRKTKLPN
jgi:hypothetical protein